ncbi:MAG: nucleotidyltransferase family protein [Candidatus Tyrphobacter sp.]
MIYVVLAAGESRRMGFAKVFTPLAGAGTPLERIAALLEARRAVVVVPPERRADARRMAPDMRVVLNAEPERGMTHSLLLGLAAVPQDSPFGVLLGDKPFLRRSTLERMEASLAGFDVAYPVSRAGVPGHPVIFAAPARAIVEHLPDGDTLARARDDRSLRSNALAVEDEGAFLDLDEPGDWRARG